MGQRDDRKGQGIIRFIAKCRAFYPNGVKNGYASRNTIFSPANLDNRDVMSWIFSTQAKA